MTKRSYIFAFGDSSITPTPGAQVTLNERLMREWYEQRRRCHEVRGNVLSAAFDIEYLLDLVISRSLIPATTSSERSHMLFDELFLKSGGINFRTKIEILRKLLTKLASLRSLLPHDIIKDVNAVRETRNDFAHYPIGFEPQGEPPEQTLLPVLITRHKTFVIDEEYLKQTEKLFGRVTHHLNRAAATLLSSEQISK